jgi:diketogulonate reductase-like aldo/keto reductase
MYNATSAAIGLGFGTAALGSRCHEVVLLALQAGFRSFDTAEENQWWYNQKAVGTALREFYYLGADGSDIVTDDECVTGMMIDETSGNCNSNPEKVCGNGMRKSCTDLRISTKIPPWELMSSNHIRSNAANSRRELVGFCDEQMKNTPVAHAEFQLIRDMMQVNELEHFPLDVYYIHAPKCWDGWHTRCDNPPPTLDLRSAWTALEAVIGIDHSARRIGLSNVSPTELLDIIEFVRSRQTKELAPGQAPPRIPDAVQAFADPIHPAEELRRICREHGIEFVSYSTLGTQHRSSTSGNPVLTSPIVQALAAKHKRSGAEVVLSWAIQLNMSVIPRSSRKEHIQELARLLPKPGLTATGFLDADDLLQMDLLKNSI